MMRLTELINELVDCKISRKYAIPTQRRQLEEREEELLVELDNELHDLTKKEEV